MPSIVIVAGPNEGDYYPVAKRPLVFGRDEACSAQVVDELVSRKHLQVRFDEKANAYFALDMKSANGVFVNGRKVETELQLAEGDILELGKSKLMFTMNDFKDRESAMNHYNKRGERGKSTLIR